MDNIETGNNIEQEIYRTIDMEYETKLKANLSVDELLQKKWVSLSWLLETIEDMMKANTEPESDLPRLKIRLEMEEKP